MQNNNENDLFPRIVFSIAILIALNQVLSPIIEDFLAVDWKRIGIILIAVVTGSVLTFFTIRLILKWKEKEEGYKELELKEIEKEEVITPNADELLLAESEESKLTVQQPIYEEVNIRVDETKGFFKKSELNDDEVTYLKNKGYTESTHMDIVDKSMERYLLKPASNESPGHFFLIQDICNYLKNFTDKVWTYNTIKPDIVFIDKLGRKVAIEVETGKVLKYKPERLPQKAKYMSENYDDWFFVVTDGNLVREYANYGKTYEKRNITRVLNNLVLVSGSN